MTWSSSSRAALAAVAALALAGCASAPKRGGRLMQEMRPASTSEAGAGKNRLRFAYPGGCFDVDVPDQWVQAKTAEVTTKLDDRATRCSFVVTRYAASPTLSLHDDLVDLFSKYMEEKQEGAEKRQNRYVAKGLAKGMTFNEELLLPIDLGEGLKGREAWVYRDAYKVGSEHGILDAKTLHVKTILHQYYTVRDGAWLVSLQFNCTPDAWSAYERKQGDVVGSLRFGTCQ